MNDLKVIKTTGGSLTAIAFAMVLVCTLPMLTGCATTNDGRSGLRGEICLAGYCLTPQAMASSAVTVNDTAIVSGARVAPATIVSQPVVAQTERTVVQQVQVPAPYVPQPAPMAYLPQREK